MGPIVKNKDIYIVDIIVKTFKILDMVLNSNDDMTLNSINASLSSSKNKTFRMLKTLEYCGVIEKNQTGKYVTGAATHSTVLKILSKESYLTTYRQAMKKLAETLNESVYLAKVCDDRQVLIDMADCNHKIKSISFVGTILTESKNSSIIKDAELVNGLTHRTVVSCGVIDPDITTVSMGIANSYGTVFGSLVVLAPTFRMSEKRITEEVIPVMREVVKKYTRLGITGEKIRHVENVSNVVPNHNKNATDIHRLQHVTLASNNCHASL